MSWINPLRLACILLTLVSVWHLTSVYRDGTAGLVAVLATIGVLTWILSRDNDIDIDRKGTL